jgi:hypothetical protein
MSADIEGPEWREVGRGYLSEDRAMSRRQYAVLSPDNHEPIYEGPSLRAAEAAFAAAAK